MTAKPKFIEKCKNCGESICQYGGGSPFHHVNKKSTCKNPQPDWSKEIAGIRALNKMPITEEERDEAKKQWFLFPWEEDGYIRDCRRLSNGWCEKYFGKSKEELIEELTEDKMRE